jgi:hypothetical protein
MDRKSFDMSLVATPRPLSWAVDILGIDDPGGEEKSTPSQRHILNYWRITATEDDGFLLCDAVCHEISERCSRNLATMRQIERMVKQGIQLEVARMTHFDDAIRFLNVFK